MVPEDVAKSWSRSTTKEIFFENLFHSFEF